MRIMKQEEDRSTLPQPNEIRLDENAVLKVPCVRTMEPAQLPRFAGATL